MPKCPYCTPFNLNGKPRIPLYTREHCILCQGAGNVKVLDPEPKPPKPKSIPHALPLHLLR